MSKKKYVGIYQKKPYLELVLIYVVKNKKIIKTYHKSYGKFTTIKSQYQNIDDATIVYKNTNIMEVRYINEIDLFLELL